MTPTVNTLDIRALPAGTPAAVHAVLRLLGRIEHGALTVQPPDGGQFRFGRPGGRHAAIRLRDWDVCVRALKSGDIGFAEAYIDGQWTTPDLAGLLELLLLNRDAIESMVYGSWWGAALYRIRHLLNRNSRAGSRKNIHAHYDLGNEFYRLWLDPTMNYSSAWFEGDHARALPDAQRAKARRALEQCALPRGGRLLEIGCGWGALAETAAHEFDASVVGVTLSSEQLAWARRRVSSAGLGDRVEIRLQDYRDIADGPFDAIVSIEMFEAVGRAYWPEFFGAVRDALARDGRVCLQSITIRDDLFERYVRSTDFIQQYIFPGGLLPSRSAFRAEAARAGLEVVDELAFGLDYAETLRRWRESFVASEDCVRALGFDSRFIRIWEFYLAYSEAAFRTGNTDVVQFTLRRAG